MVNKPTVVATIRCPCSQNRLPTILGNTWPFESGQSEVAKPASLLVTSAPAMIKKNVAQATSIANRFKPRDIESFPIANVRYALACRDVTNRAPNFQESPDPFGLSWLRHDKLKHIGQIDKYSQCFLPNIGNSMAGSICK